MAKKKAPIAPAKVQVARLDENGIYHGIDQIAPEDMTDQHVHLPDGCDLPPGKYRWDSNIKAFLPRHILGE